MIAAQDRPAGEDEAAKRLRALWASVVFQAIDDAIRENRDPKRKAGFGTKSIRLWLRSQDGHEVLRNAGVEPSGRVARAIVAFVERDILVRDATSRRANGLDTLAAL